MTPPDLPDSGPWKRIERIGEALLLLGDCREVMAALPGESVDMIWTDPPYGHSNADGDFLSRRHEIMQDGRATASEAIANDDGGSMRAVVDGMLVEAARVLKSDCCCCCCCCGGGGPTPTFAWVANRLDTGGFSFFHSVIWDKLNPGVGWRYRRQHEMVMIAHREGGRLAWADEAQKQPNIIRLSKPRDDCHPNVKPTELIDIFVKLHTAAGATVADPFMGSGTTGVACASLGRKFIGIEIEPKYFDISCERIENAYRQGRLFA